MIFPSSSFISSKSASLYKPTCTPDIVFSPSSNIPFPSLSLFTPPAVGSTALSSNTVPFISLEFATSSINPGA